MCVCAALRLLTRVDGYGTTACGTESIGRAVPAFGQASDDLAIANACDMICINCLRRHRVIVAAQ